MSCCPSAPDIIAGDAGDTFVPSQGGDMLPGESVECYMKRIGNPSGQKDDLTSYPPDKIATNSITVKAGLQISVKLELSPGSTFTPTWTATGLPAGVTLTGDTISGTVAPSAKNKMFTVLVKVFDGSDEKDSRTFNFATVEPLSANAIQFIHPLPGAVVTSKFGLRKHPNKGVIAPHNGIDLALPGHKTDDVLCAADGDVVFTGYQAGGAGNYVKVNHRDATGSVICQTVYMHLEKFYVTVGQKIAAGQKIGREGNTGIGTGAHLHFECRLNNGTTWTDPLPLIRGTIQVAASTNDDNSAAGAVTGKTGDGMLTGADAAAKSTCAPFGPSYGTDPTATNITVPPGAPTDPFERAWLFTMLHEVGPHWTPDPQTDAEVQQGLKETAAQRKKTGYVNRPGFPGGETKFGIAQGPNPSINVSSMQYDPAKKTGYNNYWLRGGSKSPNALATAGKPKSAIMLFDMCYLHGEGNVRGAILPSDFASMSDADLREALHVNQLKFINSTGASLMKYRAGWTTRANDLYGWTA